MNDFYLGTIVLAAWPFIPQNFAPCNGQLLSIAQNSALFSLLGTIYGGDGIQTFGLPDLRGRVPMGYGQAPGLQPYVIGQQGGVEQVTLLSQQIPPVAIPASTQDPNVSNPTNAVPALGSFYQSGAADTTLRPTSSAAQPHENHQPYLTLSYFICTAGLFPSRQ